MVDPLTSKECEGAVGQSCGSPEEAGLCVKEGGACVTTLDGYYVESVVCVVIGLAWWLWLGKRMRQLQEQSPAAWRCRANQWCRSTISTTDSLHTPNGGHNVIPFLFVWFSPSGPAVAAAFRKHSHTSVSLKHISLMKDNIVSLGVKSLSPFLTLTVNNLKTETTGQTSYEYFCFWCWNHILLLQTA